MPTFVPGRPITSVDDEALYPLGRIFIDFPGGKIYRYVEAGEAGIEVGDALRWNSGDDDEVVRARAGGLGTNAPAGVAISAIGNEKFGWIQVAGKAEGVKSEGGVSAGDSVSLDGSDTDGAVITLPSEDTEDECFGVALTAESSSKVNIMLKTLM